MQSNPQSPELRIAIPTADGVLAAHFGHCEHFTLFDVTGSQVVKQVKVQAPPHEPGLIPQWLSGQGANVIIAGGMGVRAQQFFAQFGIKVLVGAPAIEPEEIVRSFLDGTLRTGDNMCDSSHYGRRHGNCGEGR